MHSTPETEATEIVDARRALANARSGLAKAQRDLAGAPSAGPVADAAEARWVRVALLERRERDAVAAQARGNRWRAKMMRWRRMVGLGPGPPGVATPPSIHEATVRLLDQAEGHSTEEDLHPSALDPIQADLDAALARAELAKKNAERDARDA